MSNFGRIKRPRVRGAAASNTSKIMFASACLRRSVSAAPCVFVHCSSGHLSSLSSPNPALRECVFSHTVTQLFPGYFHSSQGPILSVIVVCRLFVPLKLK